MKKRSERMKPVLGVAERREQAAVERLGECQRRLAAHEQQLRELENYRLEYQQGIAAATRSGVTAARFQQLQRFMASLDAAIRQQQQLVAQTRRECQGSRAHWSEQHSRMKALDSVVDKMRADEAREAGRREQKESDDLVQSKLERS